MGNFLTRKRRHKEKYKHISYFEISDICDKTLLCVHSVEYISEDGAIKKEKLSGKQIAELYREKGKEVPKHFRGQLLSKK